MKLGDICTKIGSGATPKGGSTVYVENGTSFIRSQNIYNLSFKYDGLVYINDEASEKLKGVTIEAKDILLNITGDSVARTCIVPEGVLPARVNQHVAIIRPKKGIINPIFLNYYLASPFMQSYMLGLAVGKGASRNAITKMMIEDFEVPCPRIDLQEKIVDILSAYDNLIENNQKQIKLLEEVAQRLYKEWFIDLRFPGHENLEIVDGIPKDWQKGTLESFVDVIMGQSPKSIFYNQDGEGIAFHQGVGSYGDRFVIDSIYSTSTTRIAEAGSILLSVRAPVGRLNITKNRIIIGRGLAALRQKNNYQSFLFYMLKEFFFRDNIVGNGSIFASITKNELLSLSFTFPNKKLIKRFNDVAISIDKKIEYLDMQIGLLTEARDRLLPKLMSGEIEV
ncbi:MAG: restriction endonuclease subunit S [Veillonella sp.]|nr:restriction endonuclease subunit S [Veillonella sp.]